MIRWGSFWFMIFDSALRTGTPVDCRYYALFICINISLCVVKNSLMTSFRPLQAFLRTETSPNLAVKK